MYKIYCKLRDKKKLRDSDIVRETGITKSTFSDWKSGRSNPKNDKLQKIADFFDVSLDYLTGNSYIEEMGHIIQEERISQGISQEELAAESGISVSELDSYESQDEPIREDIFDDILNSLGTTYLELLDKYELYDEYIPDFLNGDIIRYEAFKKARDKDAHEDELFSNYAKNDTERRLLMLCRKAGEVSEEEKDAIVNQFEATIDMYLKAKGIKKE